jgi:hypothetical protein
MDIDTQKSRNSAHTKRSLKEMSAHYDKLAKLYPEFANLSTKSDIELFSKTHDLKNSDIKHLTDMIDNPNVRERVIALSDPTVHSASLPKPALTNVKNMLYDFFQNFSFQTENYPIVYYEKTPNEIFKDTYLKTQEGKQKRREFIDAIHLQHAGPVHIPLNALIPNVGQEILGYIGQLGYIPSLHLFRTKMPMVHPVLKKAVEKFDEGESAYSSQELTQKNTRGTNRPRKQFAVSDIPLYFVIYSPKVFHMSVIVLHRSRVYSFGFGYFGDTGDKKDEAKMKVLGRLTEQFHVQLGAIYTPDYLIERNHPKYEYTIVDIGVFQPKHIRNMEDILSTFVPGADVSIKHEEFSQLENDGFIFKPTRLNLTMDKEKGKYHSLCNVNTKNMNCTNFIEKIFGTDRISCSANTNLLVLPNLCQRKPTPLTTQDIQRVFHMYEHNQYNEMMAYLEVSKPKLIVQPKPNKAKQQKDQIKLRRARTQRDRTRRDRTRRGSDTKVPTPTGSQLQSRKRQKRQGKE